MLECPSRWKVLSPSFLWGSLILLLSVALLPAQQAGGEISGRVVDASGAVVAGVEVVAVHTETGQIWRTNTTDKGDFALPNLSVGTYEVAVSHPGFKKSVRRGLTLHVSERLGVEFVLEIGQLTETVSVEAVSETVRTESAEQGGIVTGEQIRELQLNGRSFMTLLELIPGVASNMADRADPNTSPDVSINGARSTASSFNIDGGNNADVMVGSSALNTFTSVDSIAEFNVLTSTFSAEYGRGGTSQINVVTRGGAKDYHGTIYEFFRNNKMDARDFVTHMDLPLRLNDFGFTLGGPISLFGYNRDRTKTFFFISEEFNRLTTRNGAVTTTVPTEAERMGDFSASGVTLKDPITKEPIPGNKIPANLINPIAAKILTLYPLPNFEGPGNINYASAEAAKQPFREDMFRIDHQFNDNFRLYGRYTQDTAQIINPYGGSGYTGVYTKIPGIGTTNADRPGKSFALNSTQIIRPNLVNQVNANFSRRIFDMYPTSEKGTKDYLGVDIPEVYPENDRNTLPVISLSNYAGINVARRGHKELFTLEAADNLTWVKGHHVIKTGVYYSYYGNREQKFNPNVSGTFTFNTTIMSNDLAAMLLGLPTTYSEISKTVYGDMRWSAFEAYLQDDIRVHPQLVLNLGLRVANYFHPYDRNNLLSTFVPSEYSLANAVQLTTKGAIIPGTGDALNGMVYAGSSSSYGRKITNDNKFLLGPRFGFAWSPAASKRWVVRGGYGIFHTRAIPGVYADTGLNNPPATESITINRPSLSDPTSGSTVANTTPLNLVTLGLPMDAPTIHQWSFGTEFRVPLNAILSVSYVGSHGTHLMRPLNINDPLPGQADAQGVSVNFIRPYRGWGTIVQRQTTGNSNYNSLQVTLNRQLAKGFAGGLAYTWGKSIDDGSSDRGSGDVPPDQRNMRAERAISDMDRTHIFTANFNWNLPNLARGPLSIRPLRFMLNGWQSSGIVRLWTGMPFDVVMTKDVAGIGLVQNQRPDVIGDTKGLRTPDQWFNIAAFARPATGTFGNMARNSMRLPGVNKTDLAILKNFQFREGTAWKLQFRAEMFNAFNHPSYNGLGNTLTVTDTGVNTSAGSFGFVTDSRDARVVQLALKLYF